MKKTLVEVGNLDQYICQASHKIYVDGSTMILTPGAKDALSKKGISIVYGPNPDAATCCSGHHDADADRLFWGVAAMLKDEYGVTDPAALKTLSAQVVKALKENV